MPINTYQCPSCGARVNYAVELGNHDSQRVECPRCHAEEDIDFASLPERLQLTIAELEESNDKFSQDMTSSLDGDDDSGHDEVERTIDKVENAFRAAKNELSIFDRKLDIDTDINAIAEQYAPREAATSAATTKRNDPRPAVNNHQDHSFSGKAKRWLRDKATNYAKSKLASDWDADEQEVEEIIAIAATLQDKSDEMGYRKLSDFVQDHPEYVEDVLASLADLGLGRQLVDMLSRGNFSTLMNTAIEDINRI